MKRAFCLLLLLVALAQAAKFAKIPQFVEKGPHYATTGRVSKMYSPRSQTIYVAWTSIWAGALGQIFYGPVKDLYEGDYDDLCTFALDDIKQRNATEWNDGTFCENYYCRSTNSIPFIIQRLRDTKSNNANWTTYYQYANSAYAICHLCDITRNLTSFISKFRNNTCDWSTKTSIGSWCKNKACGQIGEGPSNSICLPLPFIAGCYMFDQNLILFQDDFTHQVLIPYYMYFVPSSIIVIFGVEFFTIFIFMVIPELINLWPETKKRKFFPHDPTINGIRNIFKHWRYIFSIRHQSILFLTLATFVPAIWALVDIWTTNSFYFFGVIFSFLFICLTFIQIITLWSHAAEQSKNFSKTKLSIKNALLICISTVSFLVYCLIGGFLIVAQGLTNYESIPVLILTGMWFVLLVVVFAVFSVLLSVLTIVMFRILAVAIPEDPKLRALHFTKLKFTKLTFVLILCFVITDFSLIFYGINNVFPGAISWQAFLLTPTLLYISEAIFVVVMFIGMTKWDLVKKYYCFCCCKQKEEEDDDDDDDDDDEDDKKKKKSDKKDDKSDEKKKEEDEDDD